MSHSTVEIIAKFNAWFDDAKSHPGVIDATAMCVATSSDNHPTARILLLKAVDERGFVFFTTKHGKKGVQMLKNPRASLCFHWAPLERQVRVEGIVENTSDAEADAYFASRSRERQIGAWASNQSQALESSEALQQRYREVEAQYVGKPVPRPPYWAGWRVVPLLVEFWSDGAHRLHTREEYIRDTPQGVWKKRLLNP